MSYYTEAIRLKPDQANAYNARANARQTQGDMDGALADYAEAIRLKPDLAIAHFNRGTARRKNGHLQGAVADFQKYLDLGGGFRYGDQSMVESWIRELLEKLETG
ncbi:MAG: tetratricopeptide repeat protein [Vicinamibacterales bacterium]